MPSVIIQDVVRQHAEEAAFLWYQRNLAICAPHFRLRALSNLDERVEAHLDGLRVAGDAGWAIAKEQLSTEEPGELFTAAILAFESANPSRIEPVLNMACTSLLLARAVVSALGWMHFEEAKPVLDNLLRSDRLELRRVALAGYSAHRIDPGELLRQAVLDDNPAVQSRALRAVGELGRVDLAHLVARMVSDPDGSFRFFASWSAALLGLRDRDVINTLRSFAESVGSHAEPALRMVLPCMKLDEAKAWLPVFLNSPQRLRLGVIGIGILGDPALVSELIGHMQLERISRLAGEAFSMITGIDLTYANLDRPKPEAFEAGPSEDPADPNVAMDADEDLPWPSADLVQKWWDDHQDEYQPGIRYLRGNPVRPEGLMNALGMGYQRQRAAAALELAIMQPGTPLFEVRAPGFRQQKILNLTSR